ncbi:LPXTG cell wall anchor domain-containing protein [Bacillus pacificus]
MPKTGGDQSTTMGSLIAGGLALLAAVIFRRKAKKKLEEYLNSKIKGLSQRVFSAKIE